MVTVRVRHAQDIEADKFEGHWDWAPVTIHLRSLVQEEPTARHGVRNARIASAREPVSLGDADGNGGHSRPEHSKPLDRVR